MYMHECFYFKGIRMKKNTLFVFLCFALVSACKPQKQGSTSAASNTASNEVAAAVGTTSGIVSHKYRSTGCSTVVVVKQEEGEDLTLIPKDKLAKEYDVDGLNILFNYHTLRMPQPQGCTVGIPAEITDVSKK
jgi:hypothetical protein